MLADAMSSMPCMLRVFFHPPVPTPSYSMVIRPPPSRTMALSSVPPPVPFPPPAGSWSCGTPRPHCGNAAAEQARHPGGSIGGGGMGGKEGVS